MFYKKAKKQITVKPIELRHIGLFLIGVEQVGSSSKLFTAIAILVKKPTNFVGQHVKPFFKPALVDETKLIWKRWIKVLPVLFDPAGNYVFVKNVNIYPRRARQVVTDKETSSRTEKDNRILTIEAN